MCPTHQGRHEHQCGIVHLGLVHITLRVRRQRLQPTLAHERHAQRASHFGHVLVRVFVERKPRHKVLAHRLLAELKQRHLVHAEHVRPGVSVGVEHGEHHLRLLHFVVGHHHFPFQPGIELARRRSAHDLRVLCGLISHARGDDQVGNDARRRLDVLRFDDVHEHTEGFWPRTLDLCRLALIGASAGLSSAGAGLVDVRAGRRTGTRRRARCGRPGIWVRARFHRHPAHSRPTDLPPSSLPSLYYLRNFSNRRKYLGTHEAGGVL